MTRAERMVAEDLAQFFFGVAHELLDAICDVLVRHDVSLELGIGMVGHAVTNMLMNIEDPEHRLEVMAGFTAAMRNSVAQETNAS